MFVANTGYKFREKEREFDFRRSFEPPEIESEKPEREPERASAKDTVSAWDKGGMLALLLFAGFVCIAMIIASAWMTAIQYDINQIVKAAATVRDEIGKLEVKIEKGTGINVIEWRAVNEFGMIYPTAEQVVYIEDDPPPVRDFAQYIKENAYRIW
jgi:hypothetical protein